jgi:hypothetical protein
MDDIEVLRRALGPTAVEYTDVQLRQLLREIDLMAEVLLDLWVPRQSEKQKAAALTMTPRSRRVEERSIQKEN